MKKAKDEAKKKAAEAAAAAAAAAAEAAGELSAGPSGGAAATALPDTSSKQALRTAVRATAVPLAKQVKDALAVLASTRGGAPLTPADLTAASGHDASPESALGRALAEHAKVAVLPDGRLRYRAAHEATDADGLVAAVAAASPGGVPAGEVDDAYPGASDDVAALVAAGRLWALPRPVDAGGGIVLFHPGPIAAVPPNVAALWASAPAPTDPDALDAALKRAGIKPAPRRAPRRRSPPGPRAPRGRREGAPRFVTNAHLPELFVAGGPTSIDGPV